MNNATQAQIAAAFTEWERRFREDPESFRSEAARLLKDTPSTYGEAAAPYFLSILNGIQTPAPQHNPAPAAIS